MFAKQIRSGYILWKTGPEPVRHSHSGERPAFDCRPCSGMVKSCTDGKFHQAGEYAAIGSMGENRLPQPVPIPKKRLENSAEKAGLFQLVSVPKRFPGAVQEEADYPRQVCSKKHLRNSVGKVRLLQVAPVPKKPPGQDSPAALVPKLPSGGSSPQTPVQKNTRKVIGPSGCSVM